MRVMDRFNWQSPVLAQYATVTLALLAAVALGAGIAQGRLLLVAAAVAAPLLFLWPITFSLGALAFLIPFDSISILGQGDSSTPLTFFAGAAATGILLVIGLIRKLHAPPRAGWYWTGFIVLGAVSALWALDPQPALDRLPTAFSLLGLYLIATSVRLSKKELMWVFGMAVAGAVAASLYAVVEYRGGMGGRTSLVMGVSQTDPNQFANSLLLPMSLAMGGFFSFRRKLAKWASLAALAIMTYAVYQTMSRGALFALMVLLAVYLYRLRVNWRIIVPICVLGGLLIAVPGVFFSRMENLMASRGEGRFDIWEVGLVALRQYGWFGAGLDNFPVAYQNFAGYATRFIGYTRAPHNIYLGTWVELGIAGLVLLLSAMLSQLRAAAAQARGGRDFSWTVALEAACWAMMVDGFSLDILWRKAFWIAWILLAVTLRMRAEEKQQAAALPDPQAQPEVELERMAMKWQGSGYDKVQA